ncbi:MAG TPA: carboxypeptidase regulatory-like domain-containing protein [Terracidiphilus sp.]
MHHRLHCILHLAIAAILSCALNASGQGPAADDQAQSAPAGQATAAATLHGHITDPTGALIPGAKVTLLDTGGKVIASTTADAAGAYDFHAVQPGGYVVKAEFSGFSTFQSQIIVVAAGASKRVDIAMAIQVEQQNVEVTDESATVNTEAAGNANALVLKGKDLDALSDDPDELANEINALAGPSAGPNGGQIYIDGFSGGQLPPKSAIREIRINQNPFSAEYDKLGYGRIEILTKPGTDKLHGQFFAMGNDSAFNTEHVFDSSGVRVNPPNYYSYMFNGTVSGAINKSSSYFVSVERRHISNLNGWLIPEAILPSGVGGSCGDDAYCDVGPYNVDLPNTRIRTNSSARVDWQLGPRNTLTARYGFWSESEQNDLNSGALAIIGNPALTPSWHESNTDHTVQVSDAFIVNDHVVNETRAQYERQNENHYPDSSLPTIGVSGDFSSGGLPGQTYRDHRTSLELWNITSVSHNAHAIKFGTRMRDSLLADFSTSNYNGSFNFATPQAYLNMANGLASGDSSFHDQVAAGNGPITASYTKGTASATASIFDVALFAQDDWKVNQRFTLSGGLRFEAQNHINDHNDWAPRVGMAYALDGGKGKPAKTVLRAGFGVFYDRFQSTNLLSVHHSDLQNKFVLINPDCSSTANSLNGIDIGTCQSTSSAFSSQAVPVRYQVDPSFHAPYTSQFGASIERQIAKGTSATVTYLHSFGAHQLVTVNANQFNPDLNNGTGGFPMDPSGGYQYEYYPEGIFKQNQLITSVNATINKRLSVVGFYTAGWADSDGGAGSNISNIYSPGFIQDYGPATFNSRNQVFAMANYNGPWGLKFNPFMMANSGRPFNITLPTDPTNNFYNQRPTFATGSTPTADRVSTPWGVMDANPQAGEQLIPANIGTGPAGVAFNLRVSRGFGFGPETSSSGGPNGGGGDYHGGGGGHHGGPPGGGLGPGGLSGNSGGGHGMWGGGGSTGRKYSLNFSAQALNLFNNVDYGGPNGTIGSRDFLRSTTLAGGMFSSGSASRRIFLQATFSF